MKKEVMKNKSDGVLTDRMDVNSDGFENFQAILLNKSRERSRERKLRIELMAQRFKIEDYLVSKRKKQIQVGDFLSNYLTTFNLKQNQVAEYVGILPSSLNKILKGERDLNHEYAMKLGVLFHVDPMLLLDIQDKNKLFDINESKKKELSKYSLKDLLNG